MRLSIVRKGLRPLQKVRLAVMRLALGVYPGPVLTFSYRREFFGKRFTELLEEGMRQARHWTQAETELFAAFVSKLSNCAY